MNSMKTSQSQPMNISITVAQNASNKQYIIDSHIKNSTSL